MSDLEPQRHPRVACSTLLSAGFLALLSIRVDLWALGTKAGHREKRQDVEMPVILMHDHIRCSWRKKDVIPVRDDILLSIRHAQSEWDSAGNRRLNLFSRHNSIFAQTLETRKRLGCDRTSPRKSGLGSFDAWDLLDDPPSFRPSLATASIPVSQSQVI